VSSFLKISDPAGRIWEVELLPGKTLTIGRAEENYIVLNDPRVSRRHAHIAPAEHGFKIIDGFVENGSLVRSVNHLFVNGRQELAKVLAHGDRVLIGESTLEFIDSDAAFQEAETAELESIHSTGQPLRSSRPIAFDDKPLGFTQVELPASEIIRRQTDASIEHPAATPEEVRELRRKAKVLGLLYEMTRGLGTVFDLKAVFEKATDLIFRGSPADRVVALLADETVEGKILDHSLFPIAVRARDETTKAEDLSVSRTITMKVMREKVALLSQDARADEQFHGARSIVSQGVRSTICAPLITEANVHGVLYADRLDPFATFTPEHLELISAVAALTALTVETVKAHKRLAREEVARANYGRFMPEYVVKQLLEDPGSFRLGGVNRTITVLFADIRGFTAYAENEKPERVVGLLNRYFSAMTEIVFQHGGTLDKYIGDELMAIFGAPTETPEDAVNAVNAAVKMQQRVATLNEELRSEGFGQIGVGIGLHTGEATVGYIGSEQRLEYTAIGDTVNVAARLQANAAPGQILMTDATAAANLYLVPVVDRDPLYVKNRVQPVTVLEVKWI
jgi:adenylate cyclase